jgi:hypothetical protein
MKGHLWDVYSSEDNRSADKYTPYSAADFEFPKEGLSSAKLGGAQGLLTTLQGRGFYRSISLMNAWAHAPFLHNNALGFDFDSGLPQFKLTSELSDAMMAPDPKVAGRLAVYEKSMKDLLTPSEQRNGGRPKIEVTRNPIEILVAPSLPDQIPGVRELANYLKSSDGKPYTIELPKGISVTAIGSLRHKKLLAGFIAAASNGGNIIARAANARAFLAQFSQQDPQAVMNALIQGEYLNCTDTVEDSGHTFGTSLSAEDKKALVEFIKLL